MRKHFETYVLYEFVFAEDGEHVCLIIYENGELFTRYKETCAAASQSRPEFPGNWHRPQQYLSFHVEDSYREAKFKTALRVGFLYILEKFFCALL